MTPAKLSCSKLILGSLALNLCLRSTILARDAQRDAPEPPKIIRKAGGLLKDSATKRVDPVYPRLAWEALVRGTVVVEVTVDEEGSVIAARAISGHPLLKDAAVDASKKWKFAPTMLSGVPVKVIGTITFKFNFFDYSKAIEIVQRQLAAEPNSLQLHRELAKLFNADKQYQNAINEYRQLLSLEGDSADALFGLGEAYQGTERFADAAEAYKRGLPLNSSPWLAEKINIWLGEVYLKQGRNEDALEAFKQAVAAGPRLEYELAHYQLGMTYLKLGDKQSALNAYRFLKALNSSEAELLRLSIKNNN